MKRLRSESWWNDPANPGMTALYLERFLNYGLTPGELQSGRPIIGPPDSTMAGKFVVAAAINAAGVVLSQPVVRMTPSSG